MTVQITFTFPDQASAAAFLAGKSTPAPAVSSPAPTARTEPSAPVAQPPAAAPAESAKSYDFDKDVVPALQGLTKKISNTDFAAVMKALNAPKVSVIKEQPAKWPAIMAYCNEQSIANFQALSA